MGPKEIGSKLVSEENGDSAKTPWETMQLLEVGSVAALMQGVTGSLGESGPKGMMVGP
jgi:hypothetical protein